MIATLDTEFTTNFKPLSFSLNQQIFAQYEYEIVIGKLIGLNGHWYSYTYTPDNNGVFSQTIDITGATPVTYKFNETQNGNNISASIETTATDPVSTTSLLLNIKRDSDPFGQNSSYSTKATDLSTGLLFSASEMIPTYDSNNRIVQIEKKKQEYLNNQVITTTEYFNHYSYPAGSNNGIKQFSQTLTANGAAVLLTTAIHSTDDRLLTLTGSLNRSYTYTADGALLTMTDNTGTTTYEYDVIGNLKKVILPSTDVIEYKVDGLNRRVKKLINGATSEYYIWYDSLRLAAILDSAKSVKTVYIYGPESNSPNYLIQNGIEYRIIQDPTLGSIRYIINQTNLEITQEIEYDEFGNMMKNTNPNFQPLTFAGGLYDSDTKLIRFGARDYDPTVGRWTTKDPIGFNGGDTNLYAYVNGDPMSYIDPKGTDSERVISFTLGLPHEYLHVFDPGGGYSAYIDLGPQDGKAPGLRSMLTDVPANVGISMSQPGGLLVPLPWSRQKSSTAQDAQTMVNAVEAQRRATLGSLGYRFFKFFGYDSSSESTNCVGFANGVGGK